MCVCTCFVFFWTSAQLVNCINPLVLKLASFFIPRPLHTFPNSRSLKYRQYVTCLRPSNADFGVSPRCFCCGASADIPRKNFARSPSHAPRKMPTKNGYRTDRFGRHPPRTYIIRWSDRKPFMLCSRAKCHVPTVFGLVAPSVFLKWHCPKTKYQGVQLAKAIK